MAQILVRNLDDNLIGKLKQRALERGTSVEQLARDALAKAAEQIDPEKWLASMQELRAQFRHDPDAPSAVDLVREFREFRHRDS
jgi:plasmid stability protein